MIARPEERGRGCRALWMALALAVWPALWEWARDRADRD